MLAKLERDFLEADIAAVTKLLSVHSEDEDPIEHFQYAQRLEMLQTKIRELNARALQEPAGVALFFGGNPVFGSHGIEVSFAGAAVSKFQDLVSKRFVSLEQGPLSPRGPVPFRDETKLIVTDVVRGSFGFLLETASPGNAELQTSLKSVVGDVTQTVSRMAAPDEELFEEAATDVDERLLSALKDFFKVLDDAGASVRLVEGQRDLELDQVAVQRARRRVEGLSITDGEQTISGEIVGWAQYGCRFELRRPDGQGVIMGRVRREAMDKMVDEGHNPLNRHYEARLQVREVKQRNRAPRLAYTLISLQDRNAREASTGPVQRV
jgi:hypothetical protein